MCNFCKVNEGVRQNEDSDRLEWLQRCVQCDGLEEELVFSSMTNSLGPRKFLHYGVLHKVHYENLTFIVRHLNFLRDGPLNRCACLTINVYKL
jgi:hypothetical protein